jgi:hypothetical protein
MVSKVKTGLGETPGSGLERSSYTLYSRANGIFMCLLGRGVSEGGFIREKQTFSGVFGIELKQSHAFVPVL